MRWNVLMRAWCVVSVLSVCVGAAACSDVTPPPASISAISIHPANVTLLIGQTRQLEATIKDAHDNVLADRPLVWSSSDTTIVTVHHGLVTAVAAGSTTITVASEGVTARADVTVSMVPVSTVSVDPVTAQLYTGQTLRLIALTSDSAGGRLVGRVVAWSSSDTTRATVTDSGLVTALNPGKVNILATSEGKIGAASISVTLVPVSTVTVIPGSFEFYTGQSVQLEAVMKDSAGVTLAERSAYWRSSDTTIVTVSHLGLVTAVGEGSATISASSGGKRGTADLTVGRNIIFTRSTPGGVSAIFRIHPDGTGLLKIADTAGSGAWSPDGKKIAFVRSTATGQDIFVMNADGSGQTNLTNSPGLDTNPAWSPTGSHIAFASERATGRSQIFVMRSDGSNPIRVSLDTWWAGYNGGFSWSPDGRYLAYLAYTSGSSTEIRIAAADGSGTRLLIDRPGPETPGSWSPDGQWITLSARWDNAAFSSLYLVSFDGAVVKHLTHSVQNLPNGDYSSATFSADGTRIAFQHRETVRMYREVIGFILTPGLMWATGSAPFLVNMPRTIRWIGGPGWSRDSKHIVFTDRGDLCIADAITGVVRYLTSERELVDSGPSW